MKEEVLKKTFYFSFGNIGGKVKSNKKDSFGSKNGSEGKDWVRTAVRK